MRHTNQHDYSLPIVIICNAFKVLIMLYAIFQREQDSLVTVGDVMASFLANPDPRTLGTCLMSQKHIRQGIQYPMKDHLQRTYILPSEQGRFNGHRREIWPQGWD